MTRASVKQEVNKPSGVLTYYPEFATLADPSNIRNLLTESYSGDKNSVGEIRITRCRFSPESGIIVSFEASILSPMTGEESTKRFYIYGVAAAGFAKLQRLAGRLEPLSSSLCRAPFIIERHNAVLCEFPTDLRLPEISVLADKDHLHELILSQLKSTGKQESSGATDVGELKPLRYKPHSRLVGEYRMSVDGHERRFILRFHRQEFAARMYRFLRALYPRFANELSPTIPRPLFLVPEISAFAIERVNGETLANLLKTDKGNEAVKTAGGVLARFHRSDAPTGHELSSRQFDDSLKKAMGILACCGDSIAHRVEAIHVELSRIMTGIKQGPPGLVHGDFHQGQLLYDGERVWLLDFDRCHHGDRSTDVGYFLAQLTLLRLRGRLSDEKEMRMMFLDGYRTAGGSDWPREQLRYRYCLGLLELAAKEIRRLKPEALCSAEAILDVVESSIGEL